MTQVWLLEDHLPFISHLPGRWILWKGFGSFLFQSLADKRVSQILLFSACIATSWSKLLLCLLLIPVVLVLFFPCLCSAFSARLKILAKSRKALPSAGCVLQGQIGSRNSNRKKAKLLKSSLMGRLVGHKCQLAQERQNFRVWCCSVACNLFTRTD